MNAAAALPKPAFNPWPYALIAFFSVLITVIVGFVTWSLRQDSELIGADYYDQEMRFQQRIDSVKRTQALTGHVSLNYEAGRITLTLPAVPKDRPAVGTIRFYRPSDAKLDRETKLVINAAGTQEIAATGLRPGLWKARVTWSVGADDYFHDETFIIPSTN